MTGQPTYLLGVGATKAGTTWMYRYLAGHPACHLRTIKELHYFDKREGAARARQLKLNEARIARLSRKPGKSGGRALQDAHDWGRVLAAGDDDHAAYRDYLEAGRGTRNVVGDITPSYASMPEARLNEMASVAEDVRVVYLMREPVSRFWSHLRMVVSRELGEEGDFARACARRLDQVLSGEPSAITDRSDYRGALTRLWGVVRPTKLLVMFQENLISQAGAQRLCTFLGLPMHEADTEARVHEGRALPMTEAQRQRVRRFLQPQYEFVATVFPDHPAAWRAHTDGVTA